MQSIIKVTKVSWTGEELPVLIGTESIITAEEVLLKHHDGKRTAFVTKIQSRGAMIATTCVIESVDKIYEMYNH
jgi:hypothetical protein